MTLTSFRSESLSLLLTGLAGLILASCALPYHLEKPEKRLFRAVHENREQDVAEMLKSGKVKNMDEIFSAGTALHFAVINGNRNIVKMLIASGANIDFVSPDGFSPLETAAIHGRYEIAQDLINSGADVDKPDPEFGFTPLISALRKGHIDVAKLLVESGADACAVRVNHRHALQAAKAYGHPEFVDWHENGGFPKCGSFEI
jgi:ankyrin repeat protein